MRCKGSWILALIVCAASVFAGEEGGSVPEWVVPSSRFILQLGVLVFAAKMGGRLFNRWHLPRVLGEVAAGLLVGPHLLGGLALPLFPEGLMSGAAGLLGPADPMYGVVTISLVVFFFLIGLDTDLRQIRYSAAGGIAAGLGGFALSFAASLAALVALVPKLTGQAGWTWTSPQALLVSTVVSVSSVGMLARTLAARQRLESPSGNVALTAALTDNVVGLFLFTVFSGAFAASAKGAAADLDLLATMALRALAGFAVVALCGLPVARFVNGLALREKNYTSAFAVSAASLLIAGGVMGSMGLSVMSGAYVMGIAFSTTDLRHEIRERLDFVSVVLVPACFAVVGMQVDLGLLANTSMMAGIGLFALCALAAKGVGCALPAGLADLNRIGCLRVGVASLPRGELSLAVLVAVISMQGLPAPVLFGIVLLMAVSCACGPSLAGLTFARGGNGTRNNHAVPETVKITFQFPSHQAALLLVNRAVEIFEDDGFYAHRLNRHQVLYRISREALVIHLRSVDGEVSFECSERERPLINTVMQELSSGVEQSLRELQKPLNDLALRTNMQGAAPASAAAVASSMLKNRFAVETMKPRLLATTKQGAISELVSLLYENGLVMDRERAVQAVFEREQGLSTGLEFGLAIPHARTDAVSRLVCAVGLKKQGLEFDAADGKPARIVVLVLAPADAATPQLQLIAQVCRMLDEKGRAALLASETAEDMYGVLTMGAGAAAHGKQPSPLTDVLAWQSISMDFAPADQAQAVSQLLALCARSGTVGAIEEVRNEIQSKPAPETIGGGAALFTYETPSVFRTVAALGVNAKGTACADGRVCRVSVMLLHPPSAAQEAARVKAALARALDEKGVEALLAAKSSQAALEALVR